MVEDVAIENNSGQGSSSLVPDVVANRFNWGAFLLNWIWGLGNNTYITLIVILACFIPIFNIIAPLGLCIWFGGKGNSWAWQNKKFQSIEHFHSYQKKWATAGLILTILSLAFSIMIFALTIPILMTDTAVMQNEVMIKKEKATIQQVVAINKALEKKCSLTSRGLAKCFAAEMNTMNVTGNRIDASDGSVWVFSGDGYCREKDACKVKITVGKDKNTDSIKFSLYADDKGYLYLRD